MNLYFPGTLRVSEKVSKDLGRENRKGFLSLTTPKPAIWKNLLQALIGHDSKRQTLQLLRTPGNRH